MIDPDNITLVQKNPLSIITLPDIPIFDALVWDFDDPKELRKYFSAIESEIRSSFEYREMIYFIKTNYDMDQCAFIKCDPTDGYNIRIEIHHSPFTLFDIVVIVYRKRLYYGEPMESHMVAKEIMVLHYKLLVGLIPLSKTAHQLVHDGKLFIPSSNVLGNYRQFVELYKPFCEEEELETLDRIEKYSLESSELINSTILDKNLISYNITSQQLPDLCVMEDKMTNRITEIKKNGYKLPTIEDYHDPVYCDSLEDRQSLIPNTNRDKGIDVLEFYNNGIDVLEFY